MVLYYPFLDFNFQTVITKNLVLLEINTNSEFKILNWARRSSSKKSRGLIKMKTLLKLNVEPLNTNTRETSHFRNGSKNSTTRLI